MPEMDAEAQAHLDAAMRELADRQKKLELAVAELRHQLGEYRQELEDLRRDLRQGYRRTGGS
jgi:chaperonin cofactor prefoldin